MLSNILYSGYHCVDFFFESIKESDSGRFKTTLISSKFNFHKNKKNNENDVNNFDINLKIELKAYNADSDSDENLAFRININLDVSFIAIKTEFSLLSDEFIKKNNWYFENYIALSMKLCLERLSKNTPLDGIELSWSRKTGENLLIN